jgi:hypothetical protein
MVAEVSSLAETPVEDIEYALQTWNDDVRQVFVMEVRGTFCPIDGNMPETRQVGVNARIPYAMLRDVGIPIDEIGHVRAASLLEHAVSSSIRTQGVSGRSGRLRVRDGQIEQRYNPHPFVTMEPPKKPEDVRVIRFKKGGKDE